MTLRGKKTLSQKIISLAHKYEKVIAEHAEMSKEKLEFEQTRGDENGSRGE
jgi:hypothetical protein